MGKRICWWLWTVKIFEYFFVSSLSHYHQFKVFNPSLIWCGQKLIILIKSPPSSEFNAIQSELSAEFIGWYRLDTLITFITFDYREDEFFGFLHVSLDRFLDQPIKSFDSLNWRLRVTVPSCEIFFYFVKGVMCAEPSKLVVLDDLICRRFSEFESGAAGAKVLSSTGHWNGRQKTDGKVTTMN